MPNFGYPPLSFGSSYLRITPWQRVDSAVKNFPEIGHNVSDVAFFSIGISPDKLQLPGSQQVIRASL